ncbi:MAG TPA: hypothetical protein VH639_16690 [Bryobacteraceae bacterium]|jgi:uncharacterized protein (TIGR03437 family)
MNRLKNPTLTLLAALAALGCSDTLRAQITVMPTSLTFTGVPSGSVSQAQNITISSPTATTVVLSATNAPWLVFQSGGINVGPAGVAIPIQANAGALLAGAYSGTLNVNLNQATVATISVGLSVSSASLLSASPASLSFTASQGSNSGICAASSTSLCPVTINSSGQMLSYTLTASTQTGTWLQLSNFCPMAAPCTTGSSQFSVSVNPFGLTAGTYMGSILAQSTTTNDSVNIPVTLTVNANAAISVSPSTPPPFVWQIGTANPASLQLTVAASNGGIASFQTSVSPAVTWLVVSPLSGNTPGTVLVSPIPANAALTAGTYSTSVVITSGPNTVSIPITLIVAAHPLLQLSNTSLTYSGQFGTGTSPADQQVQVTASDGSAQPFAFAVSPAGTNWLTGSLTGANFSTSGSGATPATLIVRVNPAGLAVGTYTANILVTPSNGDTYTETIGVTFAVTAASVLQAGPQNLLFSYQTGQNPPNAQVIAVSSTGQPLQFSVSVPPINATANCPANWLTATASSTTTPGNVTVGVSVSGMTQGLCQGAFNITPLNGNPIPIGVTVAISAANQPELVISMQAGFGVETAAAGAAAYQRAISLTSTSLTGFADFNAGAISSPSGWLTVGPGFGNTPTNLAVTINPGALTPGTYNGSVTISSTTIPNFIFTVPVTLTVTSNVTVAVSPTSLTFSQAQGGPVPPSQTLTLASTGGSASFTSSIQYTNGSGWLQISPTSGTASGPVQVTIQSNTLSQGTYNANIVLSFVGAATNPVTVPVTLTVGAPQTVSVSQTSLSFSYQITGTAPASQKITVTSTGGSVAFTVGTTTSGSATGWLSTDISKGNTPMDVNVTVNPQGLTAGTYTGSVSIAAPGVLANPIVVPVQFIVTAPPTPQPTAVRNAASFIATFIAPGEEIAIFGSNIGPAAPANFTVNSKGGVDPTLAGVQVLFNGNPGTPIYVSSTQINVVVPWEINGQQSANVVVVFNNIQSAPLTLGVVPQSPALFTANAQGTGQIAATNQDGSLNGVGAPGYAPAPHDSVIAVYGTGGGQTNPPGATGSVTPIPSGSSGLLRIPGNITATIGGQPATVTFAGAAPGLVTGIFQVNVQVPTGVSGNNLPISVTINGVQINNVSATVAVQ